MKFRVFGFCVTAQKFTSIRRLCWNRLQKVADNSVDFFAGNVGLRREQREGRIYEQWTPTPHPPQPDDSLAPMRKMHNNQTPPALLKPSVVNWSSSNQSSDHPQSSNELLKPTGRLSIQELMQTR